MKTNLDRRGFLKGSTAVLACAAVGAPMTHIGIVSLVDVESSLPAFAVGSESGDWNYRLTSARSIDEAELKWLDFDVGGDGCMAVKLGEVACDYKTEEPCDWCRSKASIDSWEVHELRGKTRFSDADFFKAGLDTYCSRCKAESSLHDDAKIVGEEAVCSDCMTLDDWRIVDPARAARMEVELTEGIE